MSAEPFSQPLTRERRTPPRGSILPGFLFAAAIAAVGGVLLALYGPTYGGDPADATRQVSGGWSHAAGYGLVLAAVCAAVLHLWSSAARRAPITVPAALGIAVVAFGAVAGGMVFLDGTLHRHYVATPVQKAYRYYAWALEKDYGDYRPAVGQGRFDLALWKPGDANMAQGRKNVQAARAAVVKFRALDEQRIREARWLVSHGGLLGPARTEALAEFDKTFAKVRLLQRKRWLSQEAQFASTEDLIEILTNRSIRFTEALDRWNQNASAINGATADEFTTLCVISKAVVGTCVFTDDKRPQRPD